MASIFGHALVGWGISSENRNKNIKLLIFLAIISAILPDADVIAFKYDIPYESMFGHRGITHSIFFALIWSLSISLMFKSTRKVIFTIIFLATISHSLLDAMTTGGLGVAFFAPFSAERFFFPFRPIKVSPLGAANFFSNWGLMVLKSELIWIGIPVLLYKILLQMANGYRRQNTK